MKYTKTVLTVSIHPVGTNPIFGEAATHISIDDESGGAFIVLSQSNEEAKVGEVRFDLEELELLITTARELMDQTTLKDYEDETDPIVEEVAATFERTNTKHYG